MVWDCHHCKAGSGYLMNMALPFLFCNNPPLRPISPSICHYSFFKYPFLRTDWKRPLFQFFKRERTGSKLFLSLAASSPLVYHFAGFWRNHGLFQQLVCKTTWSTSPGCAGSFSSIRWLHYPCHVRRENVPVNMHSGIGIVVNVTQSLFLVLFRLTCNSTATVLLTTSTIKKSESVITWLAIYAATFLPSCCSTKNGWKSVFSLMLPCGKKYSTEVPSHHCGDWWAWSTTCSAGWSTSMWWMCRQKKPNINWCLPICTALLCLLPLWYKLFVWPPNPSSSTVPKIRMCI